MHEFRYYINLITIKYIFNYVAAIHANKYHLSLIRVYLLCMYSRFNCFILLWVMLSYAYTSFKIINQQLIQLTQLLLYKIFHVYFMSEAVSKALNILYLFNTAYFNASPLQQILKMVIFFKRRNFIAVRNAAYGSRILLYYYKLSSFYIKYRKKFCFLIRISIFFYFLKEEKIGFV